MALDIHVAICLYVNLEPLDVQRRALFASMSILSRCMSNGEHFRAYSVHNTRDCDQSIAHHQQQRRSTSTCNLLRSLDDDTQQSALQPSSSDPTLHLAVRH